MKFLIQKENTVFILDSENRAEMAMVRSWLRSSNVQFQKIHTSVIDLNNFGINGFRELLKIADMEDFFNGKLPFGKKFWEEKS